MPQASVAVHVRSIGALAVQPVITAPVPFINRAASLNVIVIAEPQLSVAVAVPVADGSVGRPHSTVVFGGQVSTGGVVSTGSIV